MVPKSNSHCPGCWCLWGSRAPSVDTELDYEDP